VIGAPEKPKKRKASKKSGLRLFRTFMTLVLLLGLLAGGAFAAKKYLLQELKWSAELKPIADEVAAARGLEFKVPVEMTALPISDYAARLAASVIDPRTVSAPTWRALGLVNGELDLAAVGRQALNDSPAFYDPATETILVSDDLASHEHLYRFAIRRALTAALLDQQFDWGTRVAAASPAAALAIRANIDGDALAVANAMAVNDAPEQLATELSEFVQSHPSAVSPSQYAASIAGRAGAVMRPTVVALANDAPGLAALERATPTNDAAFDAAHPATTVASPAGTQGMMFWYYVLASRIDDAQAWSAAVRWTGDSIATSTGPAGQCVDANITAGDPDGAAVLLVTFTSWANFAPAESGTTVTQAEGNQIAIRACDPGAAVSALAPPKVPVLFGAAGVEHALVQAAAGAAAPGSKIDAACLVTAARGGTATLTAPADEAPVFAVGWKPPYVDANLALATACVAASAG
jgi:hypothetical protein